MVYIGQFIHIEWVYPTRNLFIEFFNRLSILKDYCAQTMVELLDRFFNLPQTHSEYQP